MGSDKLWLDVCGRPLIAWTLDAVAASEAAGVVVVVAPRRSWHLVRDLHQGRGAALHLVEGGARRQDSVRAALNVCSQRGVDVVCVHDAARPLCPARLFTDAIEATERHGAVTAAVPVIDSIKEVDARGMVTATLERERLVAVQTPQAFAIDVIAAAHDRASEAGLGADDDCALVEAAGHPVHIIPGDADNFKVTHPHDLIMVRMLIEARA